MDSDNARGQHPSMNRLLERMASEMAVSVSEPGGQYVPFGMASPPPPPPPPAAAATAPWPPTELRAFAPDLSTSGPYVAPPDHVAYQHAGFPTVHDGLSAPFSAPPPQLPPQHAEYMSQYAALQQQYALGQDSAALGAAAAAAAAFPVHQHHQQPPPAGEHLPFAAAPPLARHGDAARQDELRQLALQQEELRRLAALQHERLVPAPPQQPQQPELAQLAALQRQHSSPPGYLQHQADALLFHSSTPPPHLRRTPPLAHPASVPDHLAERHGAASVSREECQFGTARISDNLAAHLSGLDAPLYEPVTPSPQQPAPVSSAGHTSFLQSLFGGWFGGASATDTLHQLTFSSACNQRQEKEDVPIARPAPETKKQEPVAPPVQPPVEKPPVAPTPPVLAPPPEQQRKPTIEPRKPSYSAVLAKPPPSAAGAASAAAVRPGPGPDKRGGAAAARTGAAQQETSSGGGGGRRSSRGGRRRRSSGAENKAGKASAAAGADGTPARVASMQEEPPAPEQNAGGEQKQADVAKKKKKKSTRSESADSSETLNNNPGRAHPPVQRRPLNYNNNLGSSSTLGPAQTHTHTPPPPPSAGGDSQKKLDVNVGKQKNCTSKTSNESKKVVTGEAMNKPDNKTLSQSRGAQPLNILTPGGAASKERVNKELAFRPRGGGGGGGGGAGGRGGRARRDTDESAGGELLRRLCAGLAPGLALAVALVSWLAHLVTDVAGMSSRLLWLAALAVAEAAYLRVLAALLAVRRAVMLRVAAVRAWWNRPRASGGAGAPGLTTNITLPSTGDEAMKRLLACKDKDPYSILGVTRDCSDADIKKYYRRQALLVHPDKSRTPGADEAFKILRRAFELVGFPEHRVAFDSQAKEQQVMDAAFRAYTEELMTRLREKIEETQNTLRCNNCNQRHRRTKTQRPCYAARDCATCKIQHAAREGDIWAESSWLGLVWRYYACMDGAVYDISEWAGCQSQSLKHLQANHHTVQYRIISGAKKHRPPPPADEPSDRDLEDILNNLYSGSMSGDQAGGGRRRNARRRGAH